MNESLRSHPPKLPTLKPLGLKDNTKYYKIWVASKRAQKQEPYTYSSEETLLTGQFVVVPFGREETIGIISSQTTKPDFAVKNTLPTLVTVRLSNQYMQLIQWIADYYPGHFGNIIQLFTPPKEFLKKIKENPLISYPTINQVKEIIRELPQLTDQQADVLKKIDSTSKTILLHGDTGTGKTRIYLELIYRAIQNGKSALLLTPEIGLTEQIANELSPVFSERLIIVHSELTEVAKRTIWQKIVAANNQKEPIIIIGPRSGLFYPLDAIGVIIVDESHEASYKNEQSPHYNALRVAARQADLHAALLVYGSATPLVGEYYIATRKKSPILRLTQQAKHSENQEASPISIVDMRTEPLFKGSIISLKLHKAITRALGRHEQILLYLNRRGSARSIICSQCGWQSLCANCEMPYIYHRDNHALRCHTCGSENSLPMTCPSCGGPNILLKTPGTKAIEDSLSKLFPTAKIARFDGDNKASETLAKRYQELHSGAIDIVIGTQKITKGLDLPLLSVVGVLNADSTLLLPDYQASERTFQLLYQVVGRIGRGHRPGEAYIQTYEPDHFAITKAKAKDYKGFYDKELATREQHAMPPFKHLLLLWCSRSTQASAEKATEKLASRLRNDAFKVHILGPSPCFHEKNNGKYHWQIVVKSSFRQELVAIIKILPSNWYFDIDPVNLL